MQPISSEKKGKKGIEMEVTEEEDRCRRCFNSWVMQQEVDLQELQTLTQYHKDEEKLRMMVEKNIQHFHDYNQKRTILAQDHATSFFCPSWCTPFENSFLWIAGCRPTLSIRLVYALCGSELESQLGDFFRGVRRGNLAELSARQLSLVNDLHCNTIREEDKLSSKMASLQEEIADQPLALMAVESNRIGDTSERVDRVLDDHSLALARILEDADKLRLRTLKALTNILTPLQAVDLLVATGKLHLSLHEWGKKRESRERQSRSISCSAE
ncbi:protein DOG1-like 1 [Macadamia integrifolia]|uniref:protein DOG1-like 1 n=1 Tax=Macadamia integrifolia TaxID=60698 RepID=UPI001C4FCB82|nr:protein DOG1-like 1 [Macadamia integrifolia]